MRDVQKMISEEQSVTGFNSFSNWSRVLQNNTPKPLLTVKDGFNEIEEEPLSALSSVFKKAVLEKSL
jgi:hypothetical protein